MLLAVSLPQYDPLHVMFSDKAKNNVLSTGDFYRLYYSDRDVSTNGLILFFKLRNVGVERYFNKIKCCFAASENRNAIGFIKAIEKSILALIPDGRGKRMVTRIEEQLNHGFIKIFTDSQTSFGSMMISNSSLRYPEYGQIIANMGSPSASFSTLSKLTHRGITYYRSDEHRYARD